MGPHPSPLDSRSKSFHEDSWGIAIVLLLRLCGKIIRVYLYLTFLGKNLSEMTYERTKDAATRSRTQATLPSHPNDEIAHALLSIQPVLAQYELDWHDIGRHPDCQFTSFIHQRRKQSQVWRSL